VVVPAIRCRGAASGRQQCHRMNGDQLDNTFTQLRCSLSLYTRGRRMEPYSYTKAPNTDAYDNFGAAISMSNDGNTLVIGATGEDSSATGINGTCSITIGVCGGGVSLLNTCS